MISCLILQCVQWVVYPFVDQSIVANGDGERGWWPIVCFPWRRRSRHLLVSTLNSSRVWFLCVLMCVLPRSGMNSDQVEHHHHHHRHHHHNHQGSLVVRDVHKVTSVTKGVNATRGRNIHLVAVHIDYVTGISMLRTPYHERCHNEHDSTMRLAVLQAPI